jgi:hypothetical protein
MWDLCIQQIREITAIGEDIVDNLQSFFRNLDNRNRQKWTNLLRDISLRNSRDIDLYDYKFKRLFFLYIFFKYKAMLKKKESEFRMSTIDKKAE